MNHYKMGVLTPESYHTLHYLPSIEKELLNEPL